MHLPWVNISLVSFLCIDVNGISFILCDISDISETSQDVARPMESTTAEEVLIETMDSFSNDGPTLLQRSVKADNPDTTNILDQTCGSSSECTTEDSISDSNEITIKLKFINDDQKLVTGSLKEMLGDFKR